MKKIDITTIDLATVLPADRKGVAELRDVLSGDYNIGHIDYMASEASGYLRIEAWITKNGHTLSLPLDGVAPDMRWNWEKIKENAKKSA